MKKILMILTAAFLAGCGMRTAPTIESTKQPLDTQAQLHTASTYTISPSKIPRPTSTTKPTLAPQMTATVKLTPTEIRKKMSNQCIEVMESLPPSASYDGVVVLTGWGGDPSYLMNLQTGEIKPLQKDIFDIVSPDHTHLAYKNWSTENPDDYLIVTNSYGEQKARIPWEDDWFLMPQWLDNQRLVIIKESYPVYSTVILNPFTKEKREILSDYPDILTTFKSYYWGYFGYSEAIYDPTLTRVIYMYETRDSNGFILRDLQDGVTLGGYTISADEYGSYPQWSPSGDRLAIVIDGLEPKYQLDQEIYIISRDGQVSRLTFLSDQYPYSFIGTFSWSPDGRFIAFWWTYDAFQIKGEELAVVDTRTGEVINYCIWDGELGQAAAPIWSPDGKQLIVEYVYTLNEKIGQERDVILVDPVKGFAAKIAEGRTPAGWMVAP